jgi:ribonuclease HI
VVFDQELKWKQHVQQAVKRATKTALAIGRLRQLRPAQMRQLYLACVIPKMDYASTVWYNPSMSRQHSKALGVVQRTALIRVLSSFRTVATQTLEVEAYIPPTRLRLRQRAQDVLTKLCTLPQNHPIQNVIQRAMGRTLRTEKSPQFPLVEAMRTLDLDQLRRLEKIDPTPPEPWRRSRFVNIEIETDGKKAIRNANDLMRDPSRVVFSDASATKSSHGAAAVMLDNHNNIKRSKQIGVGPAKFWSVQATELIAILYAAHVARDDQAEKNRQGTPLDRTYTIISDCKSALQAIANPTNRSGQQIILSILRETEHAKKTLGLHLRLQWVPGHRGVIGNEKADQLAKEAVRLNRNHEFGNLASHQKRENKEGMLRDWKTEWQTTTKGNHLRQIDSGLPAGHTRRLYGSLPRQRANLLAQLRTGHSWLATYGNDKGFTDSDRCECGARESVVHVLVDCPTLRDLRQQMRQEIGEAFSSTSKMLGGRPHNRNDNGQQQGERHATTINRKVLDAVLDFAEASKRFQSKDGEGADTRPRQGGSQTRPQRG